METYPIRLPAQLRQHLRSLRRQRGLTQAELGALVGVSQARIAEIEANPGLVNFEQMLQLLSVLGATLSINAEPSVSSKLDHPDRISAFDPAPPLGSVVGYTRELLKGDRAPNTAAGPGNTKASRINQENVQGQKSGQTKTEALLERMRHIERDTAVISPSNKFNFRHNKKGSW